MQEKRLIILNISIMRADDYAHASFSLLKSEVVRDLVEDIRGAFNPFQQMEDVPHCLRSEKKFHFEIIFFTFYLIKCVILVPPGLNDIGQMA